VYGNKINLLDNIKFNIEICLKASVWDLDLLANAAEKQVLTMVKPENIVLVYEMYRRLGNTNRKLKCMNVILYSLLLFFLSTPTIKIVLLFSRLWGTDVKYSTHRIGWMLRV
jgi:hypothetical protein